MSGSVPRPEGILVVDKPAGMTSHDVVDEVRRRLGTKKVGHAGTLDPDATGILVVGVGRATRLLSFTQAAPKRYRATAHFGVTTSTQDASGEVLDRRTPTFTRTDLETTLTKFTGAIEQIPPMVSAVKVGGQRLYKKARRGEEVERAPRPVTVHELTLLDFDPDRHEALLEVACSGGTYVRTLVHDIGESLGCGAHLAELRRTEAGSFGEPEALALSDVDDSKLRPIGDAVRDLPRLDLNDDEAGSVMHGRALQADDVAGARDLADEAPVALFSSGNLVAVYVRRGSSLVPERVLAT
jgi:tRNA pseudouridine55 synthase